MTGFGRCESQNGEHTCKVEVRSVNNRFIEINTRLPKSLTTLELSLKKHVKSRCARGSFDITVAVSKIEEKGTDLEIKPNLSLANQYLKAFQEIKEKSGLAGDIEINSLLNLKDIIKIEAAALDPAKEEMVLNTVDEALSGLVGMREDEGRNLEKDISERITSIGEQAHFIKTRQQPIIQEYQAKLREKIQLLMGKNDMDEARLAQETAILADRCDITEEIIRLESHLKEFQKHVQASGPVGRKLEFITQEINRETNTVGSKTIDFEVSKSVINIKSDLERIREQLQNVE